MKKFLFVCGGTGGHIFPAVAIANSLKKMGVTDITFAGRKDSMEERLVAKDWPYEYISAVPLHRGPFLKNLALPFNLSKALVRAKSVIKKVKPDVVVATGGYVSLPIVLAAGTTIRNFRRHLMTLPLSRRIRLAKAITWECLPRRQSRWRQTRNAR